MKIKNPFESYRGNDLKTINKYDNKLYHKFNYHHNRSNDLIIILDKSVKEFSDLLINSATTDLKSKPISMMEEADIYREELESFFTYTFKLSVFAI